MEIECVGQVRFLLGEKKISGVICLLFLIACEKLMITCDDTFEISIYVGGYAFGS